MLKLAALNAITGGATSVSQADIRLSLNPELSACTWLGEGRDAEEGRKSVKKRGGEDDEEVRSIHWCLERTNSKKCHKETGKSWKDLQLQVNSHF